MDVLNGTVRPPIDPWTLGSRGPEGSWLGAEAQVDGVVEHSIVGAHARVPTGAHLINTVVWDHVTVPVGRHENCVIYDGGAVLEVGPIARSSA